MPIAILGLGRIGARIARSRPDVAAALVRAHQIDEARKLLPRTRVTDSLDEVLACRPNVVVEAASGDLLAASAEQVLLSGASLVPLSLGAFADDALYQRARDAATRGAARLVIPAGAIGSLDAIAAAKESGLAGVTYRAVSPPHVYRATIVHTHADLEGICARTLVWEGSAREAGRTFPHNCNVTIGVALAGLGLDRTRVELFVDPAVDRSIQSVEFDCSAGRGFIEMASARLTLGSDFGDLTAFSVLALLNRWDAASSA